MGHKKLLLNSIFIFLIFFAGCSSTNKAVPIQQPAAVDSAVVKARLDSLKYESLIYRNHDAGFSFSLPKMEGWEIGKPGETLPASVVFGAIHFGRLTTAVLAIEKLSSTPEDYFVIARSANQLDKRPGFMEIQKDTLNINGFHALRFIYKADIEIPDTLAQDSLSGSKSYVFTNYFLQSSDYAVWLEIGTLAETYSTKLSFISEIGSGFSRLR